jgi:molybdopterin-guanine dinucleotide biosynthesis protein A
MLSVTPNPNSFSALLLAGGRSRRMGQDKAFMTWQGQSLWEFQLEKLFNLGASRVLIACREEQAMLHDYAEFIFDALGEDSGPMPAIARALETTQQPMLVLAVDMPLMTSAFLKERLLESRHAGISRFFTSDHGLEPLAGLYDPNLLPELHTALIEDQLSLSRLARHALKEGRAEVVVATNVEQAFFRNLNTLDDWEHEKGMSRDMP